MKLVFRPWGKQSLFYAQRDDQIPRFVDAHIETGKRTTLQDLASNAPAVPYAEKVQPLLWIGNEGFKFKGAFCDRVRKMTDADEQALREIDRQLVALTNARKELIAHAYVRGDKISENQAREQFTVTKESTP